MQSPLLNHLFTPETDLPSKNHDLLKKQISKFAKVGCKLAIVAGMPSKLKIYVDALLAIADGRDEFKATNEEFVQYIRNNRDITEKSAQRTVTRYATDFYEWQDQAKIEFVHRIVGGKDMATGKSYPSEYKLPILSVIAKILEKGGWNHLGKLDQIETLDSLRIDPDKLSGSTDNELEDMEATVHELNRAFFLAGNRSTQESRGRRSKLKRKPEWDLKAALTLVVKAIDNCSYSNQEEDLLREIQAKVATGLADFPEFIVDEEDKAEGTAKNNSVLQRINTEGTKQGTQGGGRKDSPFSIPSEPAPPFVEVKTATIVVTPAVPAPQPSPNSPPPPLCS